MKLSRRAGATSEIWQIHIRDVTKLGTTSDGLTGLTNATSGLTAYYHRDTDTTATAISLVTMTVGTFTSSGFKEVDSTNMPGLYQFCPPNAAIASGAKSCVIYLKGAANMELLPIEVDLDAQVDVYNVAGTLQTAGDIIARLGTPAGASIAADIAEVEAETDLLLVGVNVTSVNSVSTSSVTTVSAIQGTTIAITFDANNLPKVDVEDYNGVAVFYSSGTLASATSTTVTFPTTDASGSAIPDDGRYAQCCLMIVAGTGKGQIVVTTTTTGTARQYNVLSGTMPVTPDNTSKFVLLGSIAANLVATRGTASTGAAGYVGIDWASIAGVTTAVDFTNTTIKNLDGNTVQTGDSFARLGAPAGASIAADIAEIEAETDTLLAGVNVTSINSVSTSSVTTVSAFIGTTAAVPFASGRVNSQVGGYASGQDPATLVLDVAASSHNTAGTIGADINAAGSGGGDTPGTTTLLARLTATRAGYLDNLSAGAVLTAAAYTAPDNASVAAVKAQTDKLSFTVTNRVDSNVRVVNGAVVKGDGKLGTEWGPA